MLNRFKRYRIAVDGKPLATPLTKTQAFRTKKALNALPNSQDAYKVTKV